MLYKGVVRVKEKAMNVEGKEKRDESPEPVEGEREKNKKSHSIYDI